MKTLVSIITVCFNAADSIAATLDSVRQQTWRPLESVVVDGDSTDGTQAIVARYDDITGMVVSERDGGIYDAMNKGIALARGEILHFLNADDSFVDERVVADAVNIFQSQPEVDLVYGDAVYRTPEGPFLRRYQRVTARNLLYGDLCHQATFVRRRLFDHLGKFNQNYRINADYDWLLRVFRSGSQVRYLPRPIANFQTGGQSGENLEFTRSERQRVRANYTNCLTYGLGNFIYRSQRKLLACFGQHDFIPFQE